MQDPKNTYSELQPKLLSFNDLPDEDKPREKFKTGADGLHDEELLAIIFRTGIKGQSVLDFSKGILEHFGGLVKLSETTIDELLQIKGIGDAKAIELAACFEMARRIRERKINSELERKKKLKVTSPEEVYELIREKIFNQIDGNTENFFVVSFDTRNRLIGTDKVSNGTLTASLVHPRETFEKAIRRHAANIIVIHNHPSGDIEPSEEDIKITRRLAEAGKIMGIELLDHLIINYKEYYSFKDHGLI